MMQFSFLCGIALTISQISAVPALQRRHVVHEERSTIPGGWSKVERVRSDYKIPIKIGLKQSNLDNIEDLLLDVSDPKSDNYGKHWTKERIANHFAPSSESVDAVREWLSSSGIRKHRIQRTTGWLRFEATVEEAEQLLQTEYHVYQHDSGKPHVACEKYHLPHDIVEHVDFVMPTIHFDAKINEAPSLDKRGSLATQRSRPTFSRSPKIAAIVNASDILGELQDCDQHVTPDCLRFLYRIPPPRSNRQQYPLGVAEYSTQVYNQDDLNVFFANFSHDQQQTTPELISISGGAVGLGVPGEVSIESNLDLTYSMSLVNPITTYLYQVGDPYNGGTFNTFLDALDGSYCSFLGGDNSSYDGVYPDTQHAGKPGAYEGQLDCGTAPIPKVISTSYAFNEHWLSPLYSIRQCQEYAKLGMMGTSIFWASGDSGVAGQGGSCAYGDGIRFQGTFPATCPYVTGVGATWIVPGNNITEPEEACGQIIASGGGFSDLFAMPSYQKAALATYFQNHSPPYNSSTYNNSGLARGYPDLSANGFGYILPLGNQTLAVAGTSASSPTVASIFTIINEYRAIIGKGPVGFINPIIYQVPELFNDIVGGTNPGCGTPGFTAVPGWDPLTGLGTPNAWELAELFLAL